MTGLIVNGRSGSLRGRTSPFAYINNNVYSLEVTSKEFRRWLAEQGATSKPGKGSHLKVYLNGKQSVLPMHNAEMKTGTVEAIKRQLGLKG